jgi:hypothetical protein
VEQAYDAENAASVADTKNLADARITAAARRVAEANAATVEDARIYAAQVASIKAQRRADVAAAIHAENLANAAIKTGEHEFDQAKADQLQNEAAAAREIQAFNARDMEADVAAANAARSLNRGVGAATQKQALTDAATLARLERWQGADDLASARDLARDDAEAAANFNTGSVDLASINANEIASARALQNAATIEDEGNYADVNTDNWADAASTAQAVDLNKVAGGVTAANTANALSAAAAADASDDALLGTAKGAAWVTGAWNAWDTARNTGLAPSALIDASQDRPADFAAQFYNE